MAKTPWEKWQEEKARLEGSTREVDRSYKKPGQPCEHPEDKVEEEGSYKVCTLCGRIINGDD